MRGDLRSFRQDRAVRPCSKIGLSLLRSPPSCSKFGLSPLRRGFNPQGKNLAKEESMRGDLRSFRQDRAVRPCSKIGLSLLRSPPSCSKFGLSPLLRGFNPQGENLAKEESMRGGLRSFRQDRAVRPCSKIGLSLLRSPPSAQARGFWRVEASGLIPKARISPSASEWVFPGMLEIWPVPTSKPI
jgi:hypothetical protein